MVESCRDAAANVLRLVSFSGGLFRMDIGPDFRHREAPAFQPGDLRRRYSENEDGG